METIVSEEDFGRRACGARKQETRRVVTQHVGQRFLRHPVDRGF